MAKKTYKETNDPKDLTPFDYAYSILFSKEELPVTNRYNYFMVNNILANDPINIYHVNYTCTHGLKGYNHYKHLLTMVDKRNGVKMADVKMDKKITKEEKTAKAIICEQMCISMKELDNYLLCLDDKLLKDFMKEYKKEIKQRVDAKTYC